MSRCLAMNVPLFLSACVTERVFTKPFPWGYSMELLPVRKPSECEELLRRAWCVLALGGKSDGFIGSAANPWRSGVRMLLWREGGKRVRNWFISLRLLYTQRTFWARYPKSSLRRTVMY
jgi:hypothetical protein